MSSAAKPIFVTAKTPAGVARAAAELLAMRARQAVAARGVFTLALSGGTTPHMLFRLLSTPKWTQRVPWEKTIVFWVDERCVPTSHMESNYGAARRTLTPLAGALAVLPMDGDAVPEYAARHYETLLREKLLSIPDNTLHRNATAIPRIDMILLGIGEDGHTASIFPGESACNESEALVLAQYPSGKTSRITLTFPMLNAARCCAFLVTGDAKRKIVHMARDSKHSSLFPAQDICPYDGELYWITDAKIRDS